MIFLFGGSSAKCDYVVTKDLYDQLKFENRLYVMRERLSPRDEKSVCAAFQTTEPFLKDVPLLKKDLKESEKVSAKLAIVSQEAKELILAKKAGATLVITQRQLWLESAAKKAGVKSMMFK